MLDNNKVNERGGVSMSGKKYSSDFKISFVEYMDNTDTFYNTFMLNTAPLASSQPLAKYTTLLLITVSGTFPETIMVLLLPVRFERKNRYSIF